MKSWITRAPLDPAAVLAEVGAAADGAALLFLGIVRDHNDGAAVRGIRYEAYVPMAEAVLREITEEAAARLGTDRLAVVHRTGELEVGEASVAIAVSSPHRAEAFDACRYVIEEIKRRLPVWKQERYADGRSGWVEGVRPPVAGAATPGPRSHDRAGPPDRSAGSHEAVRNGARGAAGAP
ncbi:MAG TPA: molybdenum cofactor biosynthesis protein MoaE [Longimicrobiales bacterium]